MTPKDVEEYWLDLHKENGDAARWSFSGWIGYDDFNIFYDGYKALEARMEKLEKLAKACSDMYIKLSPDQRKEWTPYWLDKYDAVGRALCELENE